MPVIDRRARLAAAERAATDYAEALDAIREALGQRETHYLVMPGDVRDLVDAIERGDGSAPIVLKRLRER
jgi:hypothetical protein